MIAAQPNGFSLASINPQELKKDLTRLKGEWMVFKDPAIRVGKKMQTASFPMGMFRYVARNPQATFQSVRTYTFQYLQGVNTVEGANTLKTKLIEIIHMTETSCRAALSYVEEIEAVPRENAELTDLASLASLAKETFKVFSQSRRNLSLLKLTFEKESPSDHRTAYLSAYDAIQAEAEGACKRLIAGFFHKLHEGKLSSQVDMRTTEKKFLSVSMENVENLEESEFDLLDNSIQRFYKSLYALQDRLFEIDAIFDSHPEISSEHLIVLEPKKCKDIRLVVDKFTNHMYSQCADALDAFYADHSVAHMNQFVNNLNEAFASQAGLDYLATLTTITSNFTIHDILKKNSIFELYMPKGKKINPKLCSCWQSYVYQAATAHLKMPLEAMLEQLRSFQLTQETLSPLLRVYQQLEMIARVSQELSPNKSPL